MLEKYFRKKYNNKLFVDESQILQIKIKKSIRLIHKLVSSVWELSGFSVFYRYRKNQVTKIINLKEIQKIIKKILN